MCRHQSLFALLVALLVLTAITPLRAWEYRIDGDTLSGLLLVRPDITAAWGTVCGVGFDSNDAAAVCRELGYFAPQYIASAYNSSSFNGTTTLPTYYSGVRCDATGVFTACAFDNNTAAMPPACQSANHTSAASVRCTAAPSVWEYELTNNNTGRLLVRPNAWSAWGTVCNTSFDAVDAAVACRSVFRDAAIVSATFASAGTWGYDGWPVYMNDLQCTGSELRLDSCRQSRNRCEHPNDVLLTCVINSMLRLSNMNASGIVQIRPNATAPWGTVCGIGFDANDATAVCREFGYVAPRYITVTSNGTAVGPTYYSAVRCNETQLFTSCTFTDNATLPATCTGTGHATAARVECREQPNVWEYRLASNTTSGRLQLRPNSWSPWGRLCSVINNAGAWVACRSVFPGRLITSAAYVRAEPPMDLSSMPFYTSTSQCAGWEAQLSSCNSYGSSRDDTPLDTCWANVGDVVLTCGVPSVFYQLSNVTSGVIQVRPNSTAPWGTVCGVGFDSNDAAAVCRELGYSAPQYIAYNSSSFNGTTTLPTYYSGVRCDATQLFTTCAFDNNTAAMPPACQSANHTSAASVRCTGAPSVLEYTVRTVFKLSGSSWGVLLDNGPRRTQLEVGLRADIARLLNVTIDYIVIFNLTEGSLIVDFAVLTGSPASQAQLEAAVRSSAANTSWLMTTTSVYSIVSNETITVQSVVLSAGGTTSAPVTSTSPNATTPSASSSPAPSSPTGTTPDSSASSVSVLAVATAVVALLVAM
jgi:rhodanese-related sulfurtransferase